MATNEDIELFDLDDDLPDWAKDDTEDDKTEADKELENDPA
jgi:hypothetical protein